MIIRCCFLLTLFYALTQNACAQGGEFSRHSLRVGLNAALFTSYDMVGLGNYGEYSYSFDRKLAIVPRIMSANANSATSLESVQASYFGASLSARITPLPEFYNGLKLDIGGSYQRISTSQVSYGQMGMATGIGSSFRTGQEELLGVIGSLSLGVLEGKRLGTGIRCEMMTTFRQGTWHSEMLQLGLFMSVRF